MRLHQNIVFGGMEICGTVACVESKCSAPAKFIVNNDTLCLDCAWEKTNGFFHNPELDLREEIGDRGNRAA